MTTKRSYSAKAARKGKDIGKPGKNFHRSLQRPERDMALRRLGSASPELSLQSNALRRRDPAK
jgi:hypothetical protein